MGFKLFRPKGQSITRKPADSNFGKYSSRGDTKSTSWPRFFKYSAKAKRKLKRYQPVLATNRILIGSNLLSHEVIREHCAENGAKNRKTSHETSAEKGLLFLNENHIVTAQTDGASIFLSNLFL